jgi:CRISPR-associated protein (TIGR03986 family)
MTNGQLQRVWEVGTTWDRTNPVRTPVTPGAQPHPLANSLQTGHFFENPYNFIPAPPRERGHTSLGDSEPCGHHRYHPGLWSGRIGVTLTTCTPLLIPDLGTQEEHKIFGLRVDEQGVPYLPLTSFKGVLRSAYEAVTGSRMGIFAEHAEPLALRHPAQSGAAVIPVRVANDGEHLELLNGTTPIGPNGTPAAGQPQCAAWVPCYSTANLLKKGANQVRHGRRIWARIQQWEHYRKRRRNNQDEWSGDFHFWRALEIAPDSPQAPADSPNVAPEILRDLPPLHNFHRRTFSTPLTLQTRWVRGWIVKNGKNITGKHDERLFFDSTNGASPQTIALDTKDKSVWGTLLASYREANDREIRQGRDCPTALPQGQNYEFSRHIRDARPKARDNRLEPGTLCYAALVGVGGSYRVSALYPVMISRDLYPTAPQDLLAENTAPPCRLTELSPADRVFGWVNQDGHGSYKGQLRVSTITCLDGKAAIEPLGGQDGQPLAILGQPKPAQARFYAARTPAGEPLTRDPQHKRDEKKEGYAPGTGLRGRKVYPHQRQAESADYWNTATEGADLLPASFNNRTVYREWQANGNEAADQHRSITAWVKPGTRFRLDLDVVNLTDQELGALLWLLSLESGSYLRLGGGKPLGFGSAHAEITGLDLATGEALAGTYRSLGQTQSDTGRRIRSAEDARTVIEAYQQALPAVLREPGKPFSDLSVIKAFKNAAKGGTLPVHYPRTDHQGTPSGESYKWFVQNEKSDRSRHERYSLPALQDTNRGLPELNET